MKTKIQTIIYYSEAILAGVGSLSVHSLCSGAVWHKFYMTLIDEKGTQNALPRHPTVTLRKVNGKILMRIGISYSIFMDCGATACGLNHVSSEKYLGVGL